MPRTDRLGVTISLVMIGLALSMLVQLPSRQLIFDVLGSELSFYVSGEVQLAVIMTALVSAGVDAIMRAHPLVQSRPFSYTVTFSVLPSLLTLTSLILLSDLAWWGYRIGLIGLTGVALAVVIVSQYHSVDVSGQYRRSARLILNVVAYIGAFALFTALYGARLRSVLSATGVWLASSMFALELLRDTEISVRRTWLYAILVGLLMAELTWALNYWNIGARIGGMLLLIVFYLLTGLIQQHLWNRLTRRVAIEYGLVCLLGLAGLTGLARWFIRMGG